MSSSKCKVFHRRPLLLKFLFTEAQTPEEPLLSTETQLAKISEGETQDSDIPENTKWEYTLDPRCPCASVPGGQRVFFGYWEVQACPIVFIVLLIITQYSFHFYYVLRSGLKPIYQALLLGTSVILLILFLWSYFGTACSDPGFLPFNWQKTRRWKYSWKEIMDGTAHSKKQYQYAERAPRPLYATFSHAYGRYVLRPDHICGWVGNWVALRNTKTFLLLCVYGTAMCFEQFVCQLCFADMKKDPVWLTIVGVFCGLFEFFLGFFMVAISGGICSDLSQKASWLKRRRGIDDDSTIMDHWREICGPGPRFSWICPTPAFGDELDLDIDATFVPMQPENFD